MQCGRGSVEATVACISPFISVLFLGVALSGTTQLLGRVSASSEGVCCIQ